jgi:hypothetical protein
MGFQVPVIGIIPTSEQTAPDELEADEAEMLKTSISNPSEGSNHPAKFRKTKNTGELPRYMHIASPPLAEVQDCRGSAVATRVMVVHHGKHRIILSPL